MHVAVCADVIDKNRINYKLMNMTSGYNSQLPADIFSYTLTQYYCHITTDKVPQCAKINVASKNAQLEYFYR